MRGKNATQRDRRALIEKDAHGRAGSGHRFRQRRLGKLEHRQHLFAAHTGKPFEELLDGRSAFEILEQGAHGHARALEQPRAANLARHALDDGTLCPIQHAPNNTPPQPQRQAGSSPCFPSSFLNWRAMLV